MSQQESLVSVIIPAYNMEAFVGEAIESILNQTWQNLELVIVDDKSTDNTAQVIQQYRDPRIHIIHHEQNMGVSVARNAGIQASNGEFIALLDSDDIALPSRIQTQVRYMHRHPQVGVVGGGVTYFGPAAYQFPYHGVFPPFDHAHIQAQMLVNAAFNNTTLLYRKTALASIFDKNGGFYYNPHYHSAEDYDLSERLLSKWKGENLPQILTHSRRLFNSASRHPDNRLISLSVQLNLLSNIGLVLSSQAEKDTQYKLAFFSDDEFKSKLTVDDLLQLRNWMKNILQANQKQPYFEHAALRNVFWFRWFALCKNYAPSQKSLLFKPPCFPYLWNTRHIQYFISKKMTWTMKPIQVFN